MKTQNSSQSQKRANEGDFNNNGQTNLSQHQRNMKVPSSNLFQATTNLFKGFIGLGIMSLPIAFSQSGWAGGIIFLPLCGLSLLFLSSQMMLIAEKRNSSARNISEFCNETIGPKAATVAAISLFGMQLCICISYVIFFIGYFQQSFCYLEKDSYYCESRVPSLFLCMAFILPCSFIRNMSNLEKSNTIANIMIIFSLFTISLFCCIHLFQNGFPQVQPIKSQTLIDSIGIFIFAFEGTGLYFEVRHSMQEKNYFNKILSIVIYSLIFLYSFFAELGYLTFGNKVADAILFNFDLNSGELIIVVQIVYCISLMLSYPMQVFPCVGFIELKILKKMLQREGERGEQFEQIEQNSQIELNEDYYKSGLKDKHISELSESWNYLKYCYLVRIGFIVFVLLIALFISKISVFLNLIGALVGTIICYLIPTIVCHKQDREMPLWKSFTNWCIFLISSVFGVMGAYSSLVSIIKDIKQNI